MSLLDLSSIEERYARAWFRFDGASRRRLWRKLATMLSNGVPIIQALESIRSRRIATKKKGDPTCIALGDWIHKIRNGSRISDAVKDWVLAEEAMLISAGEQSGELEKALHSAVRVMTARNMIKKAVIGGVAYPLVLLVVAFAVLYSFGYSIIPTFQSIAPNGSWTGQAAMMFAVSDWVQSWLFVTLGIALLIVVAFFFALPRWDGKTRVFLDQYAPFSIYRIMQGSSWLIAMSALIEAGLRVESALEQLGRNAAPWLHRRVSACAHGVRSGHSVGDALVRAGHGFPDSEIIDDLGVYSSLSGFDTALSILGEEWLEASVEAIQTRMRVVFGMSILLAGSVVLFMVSGLMAMQAQLQMVVRSVY